MNQARRLIASLAMTLALTPAIAADADHGLRISQRWCSACHIVSQDQTSASSDAPSFRAIALRLTDTKLLANFLAQPHPPMPSMSLSRDEVADIIRYIQMFNPNSVIDRQFDKDDKPPDPHRG